MRVGSDFAEMKKISWRAGRGEGRITGVILGGFVEVWKGRKGKERRGG